MALNTDSKSKAATKPKEPPKAKTGAKPKEPPKVKTGTKPKEPPKAKTGTKPKEPPKAKTGTKPKEPPKAKTGAKPKEPPKAKTGTKPKEPPKAKTGTKPKEPPKVKTGTKPKEPPATRIVLTISNESPLSQKKPVPNEPTKPRKQAAHHPPKPRRISLWKNLIRIYLFGMFTVFPLFCTDGYFHIRHDRYYFFLYFSLVMLGLCSFLRVLGDEDADIPQNLRAVQARRDGPWYRRFSFTDWMALMFMISAMISTVLSPYLLDSILGTMGRNNGLLLVLVYGGVYFLLSRWDVRRERIFLGLAVSSIFVSLIAILNFYYLDPLNMQARLSSSDQLIFISTIGNKNFLSSYLCITVPASMALSVQYSGKRLQMVYLISAGIGFTALICADSDSGFLGVGAFVLMGLLLYMRNLGELKRFVLVLMLMLLSVKIIFCPAELLGLENKGLGSVQHQAVYSTLSWVVVALLAVVAALLHLIHRSIPRMGIPEVIPLALFAVIVVTTAAMMAGMVYYTTVDTETPLEGMRLLLRLDDRWGTNRGFIWRRAAGIFKGFSLKNKLFGSGPDTFYGVFQPYFQEMAQIGDASTNAAHNEYLNYLVTHGAVGLGAYLAWILGSIFNALRCRDQDACVPVYLAGIIGYAVQATVNIAQPITTPLFIIFLSLAARKIPSPDQELPYIPAPAGREQRNSP